MTDRSYWGSTQKILVVIHFKSLDDIHAYRSAIKSVGLNVNDCAILAITANKKESAILTEIHSVIYASEKEINILGNWKNEKVNKAISRFYDLIVVIGDHHSKVLRQLKKTKKTIAVGINTNADFLTIDLHSDESSPEHLLNFAKQTLEKII